MRATRESLVLYGRIIKGGRIVREIEAVEKSEGKPFRDNLEAALVRLCRELNIAVPIWLSKNTRELAISRRTSFYPNQFIEPVLFERFEIMME